MKYVIVLNYVGSKKNEKHTLTTMESQQSMIKSTFKQKMAMGVS